MPAKVLLIIIDAATPRVVCPAIRTGRLPTLQRLLEAGTLHEESVTIFPSITPAATTSIITGCYPSEHGIAGASWFDQARQEVAYYGDDFWVIAREGFGEFIRDFLLHLNGDRLLAPTAFEMIERTGRRSACLNYLVFRGCSRRFQACRSPRPSTGHRCSRSGTSSVRSCRTAIGWMEGADCSTASAWTTWPPARCCAT
jgi:hypothetical protein